MSEDPHPKCRVCNARIVATAGSMCSACSSKANKRRPTDDEQISVAIEKLFPAACDWARFIWGRDEHTAEDIGQDSMIRFLASLRSGGVNRSLREDLEDGLRVHRAFLYTIVKRVSWKASKKPRPHNETDALSGTIPDSDRPPVLDDFKDESAKTAEERAIEQERNGRVREALQHLPESEREAVVLRYQDEEPVSQIAEMMGCSPNTASHRIRRGLKKLRQLLPKEIVDAWTQ